MVFPLGSPVHSRRDGQRRHHRVAGAHIARLFPTPPASGLAANAHVRLAGSADLSVSACVKNGDPLKRGHGQTAGGRWLRSVSPPVPGSRMRLPMQRMVCGCSGRHAYGALAFRLRQRRIGPHALGCPQARVADTPAGRGGSFGGAQKQRPRRSGALTGEVWAKRLRPPLPPRCPGRSRCPRPLPPCRPPAWGPSGGSVRSA